jgi:metallo-beta-lactamase class B
MLVINNSKAALFDTPMTDSLTRKLVNFIEDSLKSKITFFVPNHWHNDCTAGIDIMDSLGAEIISSEKTREVSKIKNIITANRTFKDTLTFDLNGKKIELSYLGEAHSTDNIVAWVKDEKILFGGCMVRALESKSKGNLSDANEEEWPKTLKKVKKKYKEVKIVIPGHGNYGDIDLLKHSIDLTKKKPSYRFAIRL